MLLQDLEDSEYEVADALHLYHHSFRVRADGSTESEKSRQLRQLNVKVEPLGTAFMAIRKSDGRLVNLLDEAKPLRRAGKMKVLPVMRAQASRACILMD